MAKKQSQSTKAKGTHIEGQCKLLKPFKSLKEIAAWQHQLRKRIEATQTSRGPRPIVTNPQWLSTASVIVEIPIPGPTNICVPQFIVAMSGLQVYMACVDGQTPV